MEDFLSDPQLVKLCESHRITDEVLDVVSLHENQHSDLLAWMWDPREGHGQGDEILRDLLMHSSIVAEAGTLDERSTTSKFFKAWPRSRIRTTSFGSAFVARELGMRPNERVDLFVIDPQNKFILVIENKAGGSHNEVQLDKYRLSFKEGIAGNAQLREFESVFIAIDRYLDPENLPSLEAAKYWLLSNYDWLKTSADRALLHVRRGNSAAKLVASYCNRQTDWEDPENKTRTELAFELVTRHPEAVGLFLALTGRRLEKEWLLRQEADSYLLFMLQNKGLTSSLRGASGMAGIKLSIMKAIPALPEESIKHGRAWMEICPRNWNRYIGPDWWPVYLRVHFADEDESKFRLAICWKAENARTYEEAIALRDRLISVEPRFRLHIESKSRRVAVAYSLGKADLLKTFLDIEEAISLA